MTEMPGDQGSDAADEAREEIERRGGDPDAALVNDTLAPEPDDDGYDPPDEASQPTREGFTEQDEERGETLDERLAEEVPDVDPLRAAAEDTDRDLREV